MPPFFSIVISVYNKEDHIKATLESVINQSFQDFEVIVVDDGSTDRSAEIISGFNDQRIRIISKKNEGASSSRNLGILNAKASYVSLLDGDDVWEKPYLQHIKSAIQNYPQHSVFSCAIAQKYQHNLVPVSYSFKFDKNVMVLDYFQNSLNHTILTSSSITFDKSIIKTVGWFDTDIASGQDTDMWIRIGLKYKIVFISKVLVHYIYDASSLSNTTFDPRLKPKYDSYSIEERQNKDLKKILDMNRYSLAILSKVNGFRNEFKFYKNGIQLSNLKLKQRVLLHCPKSILNILLFLKSLNKEKLYYKSLK